MNIDLSISKKQQEFINSTCFETLFGGAAGGGKSFGQLADALLYALKYPKSKQAIFRRTFPELEMSIIRTALTLYPEKLYRYNSSKHTVTFINGSIIFFCYCDSFSDTSRYQSAEFDVLRFDELTHFPEDIYVYLISRVRGVNNYPKYIKSSTNPGGIGHSWVKKRFIDIGEPGKVHEIHYDDDTVKTRIFIPSLVTDNVFLQESDPEYEQRLKMLPERDKKALLYGSWDLTDGQFFDEFDRTVHIIKPFEIPSEWRRYAAIDYGLDCLAVVVGALDFEGTLYIYKDYAEPDVIISDSARKITELIAGENVRAVYAPPDLWSRSQESGKCRADIFAENNLRLVKSSNDRKSGWACIKEALHKDKNGNVRLKIFSSCREVINTLPELLVDERCPDDVSVNPHDITHIPDALRYLAVMHLRAPKKEKQVLSPIQLDKQKRLRNARRNMR